MILSSCGKTHVGMKRSHNEDCLRIFRDEHLYVVADGMGGHASGEVASEMSADTVAAFFRATSLDEDITWPYKYDYGQTYQENRIRVGVEMSNQRIFQSSVYDMKLKGMGTTIVALSFYDDKCSVGHVGDSRVYLIRRGSLEQITEDHSLLNDYIKLRPGGMTQEEIDAFPHKNVIVRALGMRDEVEVDVITREVEVGDILLLCSDGLSGMLTDLEMLDIINAATDRSGGVEHVDLDGLCDQLIASANQNGGNDNITVLLVRCDPAEDLALHPQNTEGFTSSAHADLSNAQPVALNTPAQSAESSAELSAGPSATPNPFAPAWSSSPSAPIPSPSPEASITEASEDTPEESASPSVAEVLATPEVAPANGDMSVNTSAVDSSDQAEASEDPDEAKAEALTTGASQADAVKAVEFTVAEDVVSEPVVSEPAVPEPAVESETFLKIDAKEEAEIREDAVVEAVSKAETTEAETPEAETAEVSEAEEPAFKDNDTILMRPPADVQAKVKTAEDKVDSTAKFTSTAEFVSAITTPAPNPQSAPEPQPVEEPQESRFGDDATIRLMPADFKSDLKVGDAEEPTMRAAGVPLGSTALKTNTASNVEVASQEVGAVSASQGASDAES